MPSNPLPSGRPAPRPRRRITSRGEEGEEPGVVRRKCNIAKVGKPSGTPTTRSEPQPEPQTMGNACDPHHGSQWAILTPPRTRLQGIRIWVGSDRAAVPPGSVTQVHSGRPSRWPPPTQSPINPFAAADNRAQREYNQHTQQRTTALQHAQVIAHTHAHTRTERCASTEAERATLTEGVCVGVQSTETTETEACDRICYRQSGSKRRA